MLNASAACLGTTQDDSPALGEARKRLAEASSDLAAFFAETGLKAGPFGPCLGIVDAVAIFQLTPKRSGNFAQLGPGGLGIPEECGNRPSSCSSNSSNGSNGANHHALSCRFSSSGVQPSCFKPILSSHCGTGHCPWGGAFTGDSLQKWPGECHTAGGAVFGRPNVSLQQIQPMTARSLLLSRGKKTRQVLTKRQVLHLDFLGSKIVKKPALRHVVRELAGGHRLRNCCGGSGDCGTSKAPQLKTRSPR